MDWTWLLVVLNFMIAAWNSFAAGLLWELSDRMDRLFGKFIAVCALVIGVVGMLYTFVIVGVLLNYLPRNYLIAANVVLGVPLILAGLVITVNGWYESIKNRSIFGIFISLWNTFAIMWNIQVWIQSFKTMTEVGGLKSLLKNDNNNKGKAAIFLIVAVIMTALISIGLFNAGRKIIRKK